MQDKLIIGISFTQRPRMLIKDEQQSMDEKISTLRLASTMTPGHAMMDLKYPHPFVDGMGMGMGHPVTAAAAMATINQTFYPLTVSGGWRGGDETFDFSFPIQIDLRIFQYNPAAAAGMYHPANFLAGQAYSGYPTAHAANGIHFYNQAVLDKKPQF